MSEIVPYRRTNPLINYLLVWFACAGSYLLYFQFVVPIVEVTSTVNRTESSVADYPLEAQDVEHHPWFKTGDWELSPCSVLRTAHGKILFDDYSREDPKTWLVHPFTMVLERETDQRSGQPLPPIVLRCQTGARLFFSSPVTSVGGSGFQLQHAQLEGEVELYRRIKAFHAEEDLRIETSNIQINDKEILSIEDVTFLFGNNRGMGRHMSMQLSHHGGHSRLSRDISRISGISSIRLGILSSLMLRPNRTKNSLNSERMLSHDQTPIEITSLGPFEFDLSANLARFVDQVKVRKMDPKGDSLDCDELILKFSSTDGGRVLALDAATDQKFELEQIVAIGTPAVLNARSQNAQIVGHSLDYLLAAQKVHVSDPNQVEVTKDNDRFLAKSIEYHLSEDKRLGTLVAQGPGRLLRTNGDRKFGASWSQVMKVVRQSNEQHKIELRGNSELQLDKDTTLNAGEIDITVWEVPIVDERNQFVRWSYQPAQLIAVDHVHISSEKLIADSNYLQATWPKNPRAVPLKIIDDVKQVSQNQPLQRVLHENSVYTVVNRVRRPQYTGVQPNLPVIAKGEKIEVVMDDVDGKTGFTKIELDGNVFVRKPSTKNARQTEFEIESDQLELLPLDDDLFQIKVESDDKRMAKLTSPRLKLFGRQLFLNQALNRMWVSGKGRVQTEGETSQAENIDVTFAGGMIFDGQQIYFERDVLANVVQNHNDLIVTTVASGTALKISLDRPFDFKQLERSKTASKTASNPKIVNMSFHQQIAESELQFRQALSQTEKARPVVIRNQKLDRNGKILEQLTLSSPYAQMNEISNELIADGPGAIQIHRMGTGGNGPSGFGFVGKPNQEKSGLTYIHVHFDRQLIVNQTTEEIAILGNLRSVYAPVTSFEQSFNPDQPNNLPEGSVRLHCERIDLVRNNAPFASKPTSQFIATGNAHIQSDTIDSQADKIVYRDNTDILTLSGNGGRDVLLKLRRDPNSRWGQKIAGSELVYRLKDNTANIRKVGNVSATIGNRQ